jgi:hypothetical protein
VFASALDDMVDGGDAVLGFIRGMGGGAYYCPPSADWLSSLKPDLTAPVSGRALYQAAQPATDQVSASSSSSVSLNHTAQLSTYEVASSFIDYINLVRYGLFVGDIGAMEFEPTLARLIKELHVAISKNLAGLAQIPNIPQATPEQLDAALEHARIEANALNKHVGEYLTVS